MTPIKKSLFTTEDMKNIIDDAFNGNLRLHLLDNTIEYVNPNSENILLIDSETGESENFDLAQYLNINFYSWKERVEQTEVDSTVFDTFVNSINTSLNSAYALVELDTENASGSPDIDSVSMQGTITCIMQTNKIKNFDYYVRKIRNAYLGVKQEIQNAYGEKLTAFIVFGLPKYEQEPQNTQLGECVICSIPYKIAYLSEASCYNDIKYELSLDGVNYGEIRLLRSTMQKIFTSQAVPKQNRPDIGGFVATTISGVETISYYDFKQGITADLNDLFWSLGAISIDGVDTTRRNVNIPCYTRITTNGKVYLYKNIISQMEKVIVNADFNTSSITIKTWGVT